MRQLKLALCSALLMTSVLATAGLQPHSSATTDKRVITMSPVTSTGYMIYNLGLNLLLKKDLSQIPPGMPLPPDLMAFLESYDVENVITPTRPGFNGTISFDLVRTESGRGLGHYEFYQTFSAGMVTLRVIESPVPTIPFLFAEGMGHVSQMVEAQAVN